jgi:DNA polymerase-4
MASMPAVLPAAPRIVAHLDMDAFFASVELLRYPELRGQPVVIGGSARNAPGRRALSETGGFARLRDYAGRGVITTATYEARAFGVNSAMGLMKAARLAPDAILLPVDFERYRRYSRRFKDAARALAPVVEDRGIDEIYIELTDIVAARLDDEAAGAADAWWCAREVARQLKDAVRAATGLTCSIGLAPNKLVAKIASELDKPDGLAVVRAEDIEARIWPLPARRVNGIGPKSAAKLARLGIETIGDLAAARSEWLVAQFGASYGRWLYRAARGEDDRPVVTESEPVSLSRETTFERDLHAVRDRAALSGIFTRLCMAVAADLRRKGVRGRNVAVKLRFDDFCTVTRALTLAEPTDEAAAIRRAAGLCLKRIDLARRIRLLGVRVGALAHGEFADPLLPEGGHTGARANE